MKLLLASLFMVSAAYADVASDSSWSVTKDSSPCAYTAVFDIAKADQSSYKVVRSGLFTPRYYYDLYDTNGTFLVRGITRAFSLGMVFAWGMEIDLYDNNEWIGMIEGRMWTKSRAKFSFYDAMSQLTASAHLNDESSNFLIVSEQDQAQILAELKGKSYGDASMWEMKFLKPSATVDERALQIFASFVADFQNNFVRPPKQSNHFYYYNDINRQH